MKARTRPAKRTKHQSKRKQSRQANKRKRNHQGKPEPQIELVNIKRTELEKHQEEHIRGWKNRGPYRRRSQTQLVESLKQEAQTQALGLQQDIIDDAKQKANKEARKIIIQTIQRTAAEQAIENAITVFNLKVMRSKDRSWPGRS